jgi:hypothetical protein
VDVLEYTYNLPKGWTWISTHLNYNYNPNKQLKTTDLLKPINAVNGDLIRTIDLTVMIVAVDWNNFSKWRCQSGRGYRMPIN